MYFEFETPAQSADVISYDDLKFRDFPGKVLSFVLFLEIYLKRKKFQIRSSFQ